MAPSIATPSAVPPEPVSSTAKSAADPVVSLAPAAFVRQAELLNQQLLLQEGKVFANSMIGANGHKSKSSECDDDDEEEEDDELEYVIPEDHVTDYNVDDRDTNTPDNWVKRHPELVRLTGKHPFNCEPPLWRLVDHGFITPVSLHYVRNHGYVPKADWSTWRIEVTGAVRAPTSLSMEDLLAMPSRKIPVTLVCVGNRRKEQNMTRQTKGFSWGAAGLSTNIWKGVLLRDVLRHCGIKSTKAGARFVRFEGAETLPGGGGSSYGTSITRTKAMDVKEDVMLAYEQNGKPLHPDHGFPVRLIIPGYIGGRMVKWLKKIEVTETESDNFYHFRDNRVLPPEVDPERADAEDWWRKPEYICNELSINAAASAPRNAEQLPLTADSLAAQYLVKGYAYSGGGRKVTRVEVTLDDGATWRVAELAHPGRPTKYGKHWCWCFWSLRVNVADMLGAKEICVRAWDEATNTMPERLTWNVLGMMNNCWFRIKIHRTRTSAGMLALQFEHPTMPGAETGGWMSAENITAADLAAAAVGAAPATLASSIPLPQQAAATTVAGAAESKPAAAAAVPLEGEVGKKTAAFAEGRGLRRISMKEVEEHGSEDSPWIVVHGKVYDCTQFLKDHPGGAESITMNAGTDATEDFDAIHSKKAHAMLVDYLIGIVGEGGDEVTAAAAAAAPADPASGAIAVSAVAPTSLDPKKRIPFTLVKKTAVSHDVRLFRFALPSPQHVLGLPTGKHIFLSAKIDDKLVMRAYTPTTDDHTRGYFELLVKIYFRGVVPQFPDGGVMSQHLESLAIGDTIDVKGPIGHIHYQGKGEFTVDGKPHSASKIAMLAGGTGITPMYQVAMAILRDPEDATEVSLICANRTEDDVLLKDELDECQRKYPGKFRVWYVVEASKQPGWEYSVGRVNEEMMREHLPAAGEGSVAFMCGPPPMLKFGCVPNLEKLGYRADQMFAF